MLKIFGSLIRISLPVLILAAGGGAYYMLSQGSEETKENRARERAIRTRVIELYPQDYPVVVTTHGTVQAHNEFDLSSQVSGQIIAISSKFEVGSHFSKGDVLVELDARDYEVAVTIAQARLESAKSARKIADADFEAYTRLFEREFATQTELDRYESVSSRAVADVRSSTALLEQATLDLARTKIRAPFDGRVRERNIGLGQSVGSGTSLGVIFAIDYAEVRLPISAEGRRFLQLPELEGEQPVPVTLRDAIDLESDTTWDAQIVRTEGTLDEGSLELMAVARINDPFGLRSGHPPLRIGQPVTGFVAGEVLRDVVAIPRAAVRELDQIVLIDAFEHRLTKVTIEPVWSDEEFIIVDESGLFEDMLLATTHIVYAPEGAKVEIIPPLEETDSWDGDAGDTGP